MAITPHKTARGGREGGAIILTFSLMLLFLLGFAAIAIDLGRLFIVRTELQTATDSCALAAAQELDGQTTAITRALSAGLTAGNLNRVNLQSENWDGQTKLTEGDITFRDEHNDPTTDPGAARYVQCRHNQGGIRTFILPAMSAALASTQFNQTLTVAASALATRGHAQSTCPVPLALRARLGKTKKENYGFEVGEWVTVKVSGKNKDDAFPGAGPGEMGWFNLDGSSNAAETVKEMGEKGPCGVKVGDKLGTPGTQASVAPAWNARFGIYKKEDAGDAAKDGPDVTHPDLSGYSYSAKNWTNPRPQNAYSGTPAPGSHATAENFITKRSKFASFDDTGSDIEHGAIVVFPKANALNGFKKVATPGATGEHAQYGYNRRIVVVPVLSDSNGVIDFACMFMLAPLQGGPEENAQMEFRGNAGDPNSPCTTNGMAGGSAGPLVPVLVR